jgi:uncharacterized protein YndB with AHSA1/START domain
VTYDDPVIVERRVAVPPERVFAYFTDSARWTAWQGTEAEIELRPGGIWRVNVTGDGFASGKVVEVVPNRRVVFTWGWEGSGSVPPGSTTVEITLQEDGDGTLLRLRHTGFSSDADADLHREGWEMYVARLAAVSRAAAGGP